MQLLHALHGRNGPVFVPPDVHGLHSLRVDPHIVHPLVHTVALTRVGQQLVVHQFGVPEHGKGGAVW